MIAARFASKRAESSRPGPAGSGRISAAESSNVGRASADAHTPPRPPLAADQLAPVVRAHPGAETALALAFDPTESMRIMHTNYLVAGASACTLLRHCDSTPLRLPVRRLDFLIYSPTIMRSLPPRANRPAQLAARGSRR